jgi:light-regulated signal transduction histidine kinase (bacteriophytochrome)
VLHEASLFAEPCADIPQLARSIEDGVGALLIAEEALVANGMPQLVELFARQSPWSDLPMILMTSGGELTQNRMRNLDLFCQSGNMTLLERPFRPLTLVSAVRVALRARRRQYEVRALLEQRESKAAELARSNEELEQFAYIASHDLQEPLRMIASYLQLLEKRHSHALDEQALRYINFAVSGAKRMQDLINAILDFSRARRQESLRETVDLNRALGDALSNLDGKITHARAQIVAQDLPTLTAIPTQMVQLLQNLIGNAIKFRSERTPVIRIDVEDAGAFWSLSVSDNGIGIRGEDCDRLFKIFQRLHTLDEYPGSGIGLATCKKIVEHHGGRIWLESEFGAGSTFRFTLPKLS